MKTYPRNPNIPAHFAAWLRDHNHSEEACGLYKLLIDKAPRSFKIRHGYGRLLLNLERFDAAVEQFREALEIHRGHQMAHEGLAQALCGMGGLAEQEGRLEEADRSFKQAEREFRSAIYWAKVQKQPQAVFYSRVGWFYIDRSRYADAIDAFESAIGEDPDYFGNYWGLGRALMGLGQFQEAADSLRTALDKSPEDFQPPASEEIPELLRQCQVVLGIGNDDDAAND